MILIEINGSLYRITEKEKAQLNELYHEEVAARESLEPYSSERAKRNLVRERKMERYLRKIIHSKNRVPEVFMGFCYINLLEDQRKSYPGANRYWSHSTLIVKNKLLETVKGCLYGKKNINGDHNIDSLWQEIIEKSGE